MASLKSRRGVWYARVLWYDEQKKKERQGEYYSLIS